MFRDSLNTIQYYYQSYLITSSYRRHSPHPISSTNYKKKLYVKNIKLQSNLIEQPITLIRFVSIFRIY